MYYITENYIRDNPDKYPDPVRARDLYNIPGYGQSKKVRLHTIDKDAKHRNNNNGVGPSREEAQCPFCCVPTNKLLPLDEVMRSDT
jgi:hypothetical protein